MSQNEQSDKTSGESVGGEETENQIKQLGPLGGDQTDQGQAVPTLIREIRELREEDLRGIEGKTDFRWYILPSRHVPPLKELPGGSLTLSSET